MMTREEQYRVGMAAYHAGRHEKAVELLTPLLDAGSSVPTVLCRYYLGQSHFALGVRCFKQRKLAEATRQFQQAAARNAQGAGLGAYLVACFVGQGRYELAAREMEPMLGRDPADVPLRIRTALAQYKHGVPLEAISTLREGLRFKPDEAELHYQHGVLLAAEQDYLEAERSFELAVSYDPQHAAAYERLAQVCGVSGRSERALTYLQRAHALDPWNARICFQLSILGNQTGANAVLAPAAETAPPLLDEQGVERLGQLIAQDPDFVESFLSLPASDVDGEVFTVLAATLERALEHHPEFADLHHHCAGVYRRLGRRMEAVAHAERSVAINPRYVRALIQLAELYAETEQWAMGVERLRSALSAGADYPDVHYLMGRLYEAGGQKEQARRSYARALDLHGGFPAAREALAALPA